MKNHHFFLGGNDLEMETIRHLLRQAGVAEHRIHDKRLGWGARASDYLEELAQLPRDTIPVFLELENDLEKAPDKAIFLDHHGPRAGIDNPTVLEQLWQLLEMPPEQWGKGEFSDYPLVAANDRGYIPALRRLDIGAEKIAEIRARDRAAQGITREQEAQAEAALENLRRLADGRLLVVELPHDRIAPVTDRLALEEGYRNLLIRSPNELNFSGEGTLVCALNDAFPGGWYGGELPEQGYWGVSRKTAEPEAVEGLLRRQLE